METDALYVPDIVMKSGMEFAEFFIYRTGSDETFASQVIPNKTFATYEEAVAATAEYFKQKEN